MHREVAAAMGRLFEDTRDASVRPDENAHVHGEAITEEPAEHAHVQREPA
jgi:hypothetical protein